MNADIIKERNDSVASLSESMGYTVIKERSYIDILLGKKKVFAYTPSTNTLFAYDNKYSKQLDDRYLSYVRVCLEKKLPKPTISFKDQNRYVVETRGVRFAIYDSFTGSKIESYSSYSKANIEASSLNKQWVDSIYPNRIK